MCLGLLLGPLLGIILAPCWRSWGVLGCSWAILGRSWGYLGWILNAVRKEEIPTGLHIPKSFKNNTCSCFFESHMMRATRRHDIPRGLHIPKSLKNHWFFHVFWRSHDKDDAKTRDSKKAAYPKMLQKPLVFLGFLKVTWWGRLKDKRFQEACISQNASKTICFF